MNWIFVILIVLAAVAVVVALIRGLIAFATMDANDVDENGIARGHKKQNEMMFARVKYQAIAVILIALMILVAGGTSGS